MWIVKLGGSLAREPALRSRLAAIVAETGTARLIVPGGGPFADAVRALQPVLGFDELAAHRMAILAMQQHGLHLAGLEPRLRLVENAADIARLRADGAAGVWLPWAMIGRDTSIPASWDVTSDSLALILATRLRADGLVLVKAAGLPDEIAAAPFLDAARIAALAEAGILDPVFPALARGFRGLVRVVGR